MDRGYVRIRNRARGKGWGNFGVIVSYTFRLVRCLLCHLILFKKTLIMVVRLEFDNDVTCSEPVFTLVTCLQASLQALYRM